MLRRATARPGPLLVADLFAGAGVYDFAAAEARKTGEAEAGIGRLLAAAGPLPELVAPLVERVRALDPGGRLYPGSPELARAMLRPCDRLVLVERHPREHAALVARYAGHSGVEARCEDGYRLLARTLPQAGRGAVVLVDPAYELEGEETRTVEALGRAVARQPAAVYLLWYPVLERAQSEAFLGELATCGLGGALRVELGALPDGAACCLTASGMAVLNAPRGLERWLARELPALAALLGVRGPRLVARLTGRPAARRRQPLARSLSGAPR